MFRGKVIIYKTDPRTGKVYQVEKEFTDPREYEAFVSSHPELVSSFTNFGGWSLDDFIGLEKLIDQLIGRRLGFHNQETNLSTPSYEYEELPVDISKYEYEAKKLEEEKRKLLEKKKKLQDALRKLEEYKKQFEEAGKEDLLKSIDEDIKKVKEEIEKINDSLKNYNKKNK